MNAQTIDTWAAEWQARSAYHLATSADCHEPDHLMSCGADFLRSVRDDLIERVRWNAADDDAYCVGADDELAHAIADAAVPVYTHQIWQTFVDLGAYDDPDAADLTEGEQDMTRRAMIALYCIGLRLADAMIADLAGREDA